MDRELSWHDLQRAIEEHEDHHNFHVLKAFCNRFYPGATLITVQAVQEYDDNNYYYSFGPSQITVVRDEQPLLLPDDDVGLLVLLAGSPSLQADLKQTAPEDPVLWLADVYYDEVYNLELCGIEKGYDVEVNLLRPPPPPSRVYTLAAEETQAGKQKQNKKDLKEGVNDALPHHG